MRTVSRPRRAAGCGVLPILGLALAAPCFAQEEAPKQPPRSIWLTYRFARLAGKVAVYRIQNKLSQSKRVAGKREQGRGSAESLQRQTYECRFERGAQGLGKVKITPTRIAWSLTENDQVKYEYDSRDGQAPPPRLRALTQLLHRTATLEVTRHGEVKQITGVKATQHAAYRGYFHRLPARALGIGQGWEQKKKEPIPPFGNLHYFTTFRLKEIVPAQEGRPTRRRIEASILVSYERVQAPAYSKLEITKQSGGGHLLFDEDGLLLEEKMRSEVEYTIKGLAGTEVYKVTSETTRWLTDVKEAEGRSKD